jgi:hypothetical protein
MADKLDQALTRRWADHRRFLVEGAMYSAAIKLAEMDNCLRNTRSDDAFVEKWKQLIDQAGLADDQLTMIYAEAQKRIGRLKRILGIGSQFSYEELLLAVTDRIELDLLQKYLHVRKLLPNFDTRELDEDLVAIANSRQNSGAFQSAQAAAKRNWGLPVKSRWLDDVQR